VVDDITAAYIWDNDAGVWQPIVTNFKGDDGQPGTNGQNGQGFNFRGVYDNAATYQPFDVVRLIHPQTNAIGIWRCKLANTTGKNPTTNASEWELILEAEQAHPAPHPQFKAEAIWDTTPASTQDMAVGATITKLNVKWNILSRSAADEVITKVDIRFSAGGVTGYTNIQNANNEYTYPSNITQPNRNQSFYAELVITTNKNNTVTLRHFIQWKLQWYSGFLNKTGSALTAADITGAAFTAGQGASYPRSVRIQGSGNVARRAFIALEEVNRVDLPDNWHLDLFPYLHRVSGKTISSGGKTYVVYASTQLTHANDLTVTAAYS
jgi:hypothetical protein